MARATLRIVEWHGRRVMKALEGTLARNIRPAVALLEHEVKTSMKGGGTPHIASLPGEPPRVDTGTYRARISSEVEIKPRRVVGRVVSPSAQARALEFGYAPGGLEPRPHLRPALTRRRIDIYRRLIGSARTGPATLSEISGAVALNGGLM